jgi:hypothetical protein
MAKQRSAGTVPRRPKTRKDSPRLRARCEIRPVSPRSLISFVLRARSGAVNGAVLKVLGWLGVQAECFLIGARGRKKGGGMLFFGRRRGRRREVVMGWAGGFGVQKKSIF